MTASIFSGADLALDVLTTFSGAGLVLDILTSGMSAIDVERWQKSFFALRCLIKGSKPLSFEITWKCASGFTAANCPM